MSIEEIQPDPERDEENRRLKVGYFELYEKRFPINADPANCVSPEDAYMLHLEKKYLNIPEHLKLENILDDIPKEHHERLVNIWLALKEHQNKLEINVTALHKTWENPPQHTPDETAINIVEESTTKIYRKFKKGTVALISKSEELKIWQAGEKGARMSVYLSFKNYITSLRGYYEILLEHGQNKSEYILPHDHIHREEIAMRNRILRVIDAFHQAFEGTKAAHHGQGKRRLRKAENKPFVTHEMRTALAAILDILPYTLEEKNRINKIGLITLTIACAIHDTKEDTGLSIDQIMEKYVQDLLNFIDSSLAPHIKPVFNQENYLKKARKIRKGSGKSQGVNEESMVPLLFQEDSIHLVGRHRKTIIRQILRIISKNEPLKNRERKRAYKNNIAGKRKIRTLLDIQDKDLKRWKLIDRDEKPTAKTFRAWQEEYDGGEMARFLLQLDTITKSKQTRKNALLVKTEDRADNVATLKNMDPEHQLKTLRVTVTRLIAWCMLDYKEHKEFPLYNALPRLIDTTLREYKRVQTEHPDLMQKLDIDFIEHLTDWQREVIRFEIPAKVREVLEEYEEAKYKVRKPTPSDSQLPLPYFEP